MLFTFFVLLAPVALFIEYLMGDKFVENYFACKTYGLNNNLYCKLCAGAVFAVDVPAARISGPIFNQDCDILIFLLSAVGQITVLGWFSS